MRIFNIKDIQMLMQNINATKEYLADKIHEYPKDNFYADCFDELEKVLLKIKSTFFKPQICR